MKRRVRWEDEEFCARVARELAIPVEKVKEILKGFAELEEERKAEARFSRATRQEGLK